MKNEAEKDGRKLHGPEWFVKLLKLLFQSYPDLNNLDFNTQGLKVALGSIDRIRYKSGHRLEVHVSGPDEWLETRFRELEETVEGFNTLFPWFIRVNSGYAINMLSVSRINRKSVVVGGQTLVFSRKYLHNLKKVKETLLCSLLLEQAPPVKTFGRTKK